MELNILFDLSKINWINCEKFALSNRVKEACNYWNNGIENVVDIGKIMKLSRTTICNYLKKGSIVNWCNYNAENELIKRSVKNGTATGKYVEAYKNNISLGIFESATDLERKSKELFGVRLGHGAISSVCRNKKKSYKGYTFRYLTPEELEKYKSQLELAQIQQQTLNQAI